MKEIGAYEAKTQLPRLLREVATKKCCFALTKHGQQLAWLVPPPSRESKSLLDTVAELRAFATGRKLAGLSVRAMRNEGRR